MALKVNSALGDHGELLTGWAMRNVDRPARVDKAHSETAYMTDRAIEVIKNPGDEAGVCTFLISSRIGLIWRQIHIIKCILKMIYYPPYGAMKK